MMKKDKILLTISDIKDKEKYEKLGISNFLFALKDYSVGYTDYTFEEIRGQTGNIFVLVNRLLTDDDIDEFLKLEIPKNIKGFIIEDTGLYYELKNKGYTLINFQNHLNNNYETVNFWLKHFDSLVLSTDLTDEELILICNNSDKPLILNTIFKPMIMYSRRNLVNNFYKHIGKETKNIINVNEKVSGKNFILRDSKYGTSVFNDELTSYMELVPKIDDNKILYYLVNTEFIPCDKVIDLINNKLKTDTGFLHKKTIYKVGDKK